MKAVTNRQIAVVIADAYMKDRLTPKRFGEIAALLITERRSRELPTLMRLVEKELQRRGRPSMTLRSARPLSAQLKQQLTALLGIKNPIMHEIIEPALIGGVVAETGDRQLNMTVQARLQNLRQYAKKGI